MPDRPTKPPIPRRILIVRLSAHGDTVQTLPLLTALRQQAPEAYIGWLVEDSAAPLLVGHPFIDRLHVSHRKAWLNSLLHSVRHPRRWPEFFRTLAEIRRFIAGVRAEGYEVAVDVQGLLKSAIWPALARIPRRAGYRRARENAHWLYTETIAPMEIRNPTQGAIWKYLEFLPLLGLRVPEAVRWHLPPVPGGTTENIRVLLASLPQRPLIALAPATRWESKHWPVAHWRALLKKLTAADYGVVLLGSPADQTLTSDILQGAPAANVLDLTGRTRLPDLYALFPHVDVLVGPDSAPLHIADAVSDSAGRPHIVALFGPTAPGRTGPVGEGHRMLAEALSCQPCFERQCPLRTHACMMELSPEQVFQVIQERLSTWEVRV